MSRQSLWTVLCLAALIGAGFGFPQPARADEAPNPLALTTDALRAFPALSTPGQPAGGGWTVKTPMSVPRDRLAVVSDGTRIFAIGGEVRSGIDYNPTTLVEAYDPVADTWTTVASLPTAARNLHGCYMNGKIYVPNGLTGSSTSPVFSPTLWIYTVGTNSWTTGANFPTTAVIFHAVACDPVGNKVYVAGGANGTGSGTTIRNGAYVYNATTNAWSALPNLPAARYGAVGYWLNGLFLVAGGDTNNTAPALTSTLAYDPGSNAWSTVANLLTDRNQAAGAMVSASVALAVGGGYSSAGYYLNSVESYSGGPQWGPFAPLNVARVLLGAAGAGNAVCAVGGFDGINGNTNCDDQSGLCSLTECYATGASFGLQVDPGSAAICAPGNTTFQVSLSALGGYTGNVTLSALDLPSGVSAQFSPNPVAVPGSSQLTLTVSAQAVAGDYTITVQATDGSITRTQPLQIQIRAAVGTPSLISPANNATSVSVATQLTWSAAANAETYDVQVAEDLHFTSLVASRTGISSTTWAVSPTLNAGRTLHWRVRAVNACSMGDWTESYRFTTQQPAAQCVLLVDDDDNAPDLKPYYEAALNTAGISYGVFEVGTGAGNGPDLATMQAHPHVVWFAGDKAYSDNGPGASDEGNLAAYLNGGGHLMLSAQDYMRARSAGSTFDSDYLGVSDYQDAGNTSVSGQTGNPIASGVGTVTLGTPPSFQNFSDSLTLSSATTAFTNNNSQPTVVNKASGAFKTVFFSTEWGQIYAGSILAGRQVLNNVITWFGGCPPPPTCVPADVNCSGGTIDVVDITLTAQAWHDFAQTGYYEADYDLNHDNVIDIVDLQLDAAAWGQPAS